MIETTEKLKILDQIIQSEAFENSEKYATLLRYLVEESIAGNTPKEYTIAIDVLKKGKDFNPAQDTIVRYYMHKLRQKIKSYYDNQGQYEKVRLVIPKGHYKVKFQPREKSATGITNPKQFLIYALSIACSIFIILSTILYYKYQNLQSHARPIENPIPLDDPVWSNFFNNELQTTLLIGDHFLFEEYDANLKRNRYIIDHEQDFENRFDRYINQFPDRRPVRMVQGSLPLNSVFNLNDLNHVFNSFSKNVNIELSSVFMSSQFDSQKLNDRNIIYIGGFRNLRLFRLILDKIPMTFSYSPKDFWRGELIYQPQNADSIRIFKSRILKDNHYSDLGLVAKLPGSKNENYMILAGFAYPAQTEIVRIMSRNSSLAAIYAQTSKQISVLPEYFIMVFEVIGSEYSAIETNLLFFREISFENR